MASDSLGTKSEKGLQAHLGVAQNQRTRVTQVLVFGSIYPGAMVHVFKPQPFEWQKVVAVFSRDLSRSE